MFPHVGDLHLLLCNLVFTKYPTLYPFSISLFTICYISKTSPYLRSSASAVVFWSLGEFSSAPLFSSSTTQERCVFRGGNPIHTIGMKLTQR